MVLLYTDFPGKSSIVYNFFEEKEKKKKKSPVWPMEGHLPMPKAEKE